MARADPAQPGPGPIWDHLTILIYLVDEFVWYFLFN